MGKAYKDGETFVVELSTSDVVKRVVMTRGLEYISVPRVLNEIAWEIISSTPALQKLVGDTKYTWCSVEALDGRFSVVYRNSKVDMSDLPCEKAPLTDINGS